MKYIWLNKWFAIGDYVWQYVESFLQSQLDGVGGGTICTKPVESRMMLKNLQCTKHFQRKDHLAPNANRAKAEKFQAKSISQDKLIHSELFPKIPE